MPAPPRRFQATTTYVIATLLSLAAAQSADWYGTFDSDFQNADNWRTGQEKNPVEPPVSGSDNASALVLRNGNNPELVYTNKEGDTVFAGQLLGGFSRQEGHLKVTGGILSVKQSAPGILGQTVPGSVVQTGGTLNLLGGGRDQDSGNPNALWSLIIGNESEGSGTLEISGGETNLDYGLQLGRRAGTGIVTISRSGRFTCGGPSVFSAGAGEKKIVLGEGPCSYTQASDGEISFADGKSNGYITFAKKSGGAIILKGKDRAYFEKLVAEGRIRINDAPARVERFQFREVAGSGEYRLAQ